MHRSAADRLGGGHGRAGYLHPMPPDVWLRGPLPGFDPVVLPAAHALLQSEEDLERAVADLPPGALWARPGGAASLGFHLAHIAGSIDRLLAFAANRAPSEVERAALAAERRYAADDLGEAPPTAEALLGDARRAIHRALDVLRATPASALAEPREIGRARLPSSVWGILFHVAEHTQRHAGQVITTAKVVRVGAVPAAAPR
jgi:hypothetical protein